jgi:hypothetical protein
MSFRELALRHFTFLVENYGYSIHADAEDARQETVRFDRFPLSVNLGWYKGEVDIVFEVAFAFARDHAVFRPFVSRRFNLAEILGRIDERALMPLKEARLSGGWISGPTFSTSADNALRIASNLMQAYCGSILSGQLGLLEKITAERAVHATNG